MQKVEFIPVTEFAPDSVEWDVPLLEECNGYFPIYGGLRAVKVHKDMAVQQLANSIVTGSHAHLITSGQLDEWLSPSSLDSGNMDDYIVLDDTLSESSNLSDLGGKNPSDDTFLKYRQSLDLGAGEKFIMPLSNPTHTTDGTATWTFFIRYRTTSGFTNWTLDAKWQEWDGGTWNDVDSITQQSSATAQTEWTTVEESVANPAPTNADDLRIVIEPRSTDNFTYIYDAPTSDNTIQGDGWVNELGGSVLYTSVDDAFGAGWGVGADTTYIESASVEEGVLDSENFIIFGLPYLEDLRNDEGDSTYSSVWRQFNIRARHTGASGNFRIWQELVDVRTGEIIDNDEFGTSPKYSNTITTSFANYDGSIATSTREFSDSEIRENLGIKIYVENVDAPTASTSTNYPTGVSGVDAPWTDNGGGALTAADVGAGGSAYAKASTKLKNVDFVANFGSITQPDDLSNVYVRIRARVDTTTGGPRLRIRNNDNGSTLLFFDVSNTGNWKTYSKRLSVAQATALSWGGTLDLEVATAKNTGDNAVEYNVDWIRLEVPGSEPKVQISAVASEAPGCHGFDISWNMLQTIADTTATPTEGDLNRLFFGTLTKMHLWDDSSISQFSNTFGAGTYPMSWDFASFGGDVYMTNFADRPLVWTPSSPSTLSNAHTAGDIADGSGTIADFKYKFVESVGDHLVVHTRCASLISMIQQVSVLVMLEINPTFRT
jgi:hypothetical protein